MKDLFIAFLKENNLYFRFIAYLVVRYGTEMPFEQFLDTYPAEDWVDAAFHWMHTDEGEEYWLSVDGKWRQYRAKNAKWKYTLTFVNSELDNSKLFQDLKKLLEQQYGVRTAGNLRMDSVKLSK